MQDCKWCEGTGQVNVTSGRMIGGEMKTEDRTVTCYWCMGTGEKDGDRRLKEAAKIWVPAILYGFAFTVVIALFLASLYFKAHP